MAIVLADNVGLYGEFGFVGSAIDIIITACPRQAGFVAFSRNTAGGYPD